VTQDDGQTPTMPDVQSVDVSLASGPGKETLSPRAEGLQKRNDFEPALFREDMRRLVELLDAPTLAPSGP
jgi:hypothetical protein